MTRSNPNRPLRQLPVRFFADQIEDLEILYPTQPRDTVIRTIIDAFLRLPKQKERLADIRKDIESAT